MDNKDFTNLGEQIRKTVQNAVDSKDFKELNQTISATVDSALEEARSQLAKGMKTGAETVRKKAEQPGYRAFQTSRSVEQEKKEVPVRMNQRGRVSGILYTVFGSIGIGFTVFLAFTFWLATLMVSNPGTGIIITLIAILLAIGGASGAMLGAGISISSRLSRAKRYLRQAGKRKYCTMEELAECVKKPVKFVIKDLQKIIDKGIFPEGHLDHQKTCLILDQATYAQYLESQKALENRQREALALEKKRQEEEKSRKDIPEEVRKMMEEGRKYVTALREANDAIPGQVISEKISRLERIIVKIFNTVEKHPEAADEMEQFMDYYLPTTAKLVNAYRDFDSVEIAGGNIASAKREIEETLDTINLAFERLLDDLYQDAAFDISTDASVLQTMLKQDGWMESDFTGGKKNE